MKSKSQVFLALAFSFCLILSDATSSVAQWITYETKEIATGLNVPWEIRWGKDNWIWFTERSGRFDRVNPETGERKILLQIPDALHDEAEKGTLGFDFHPDFPDSSYVFIAYNHQRKGIQEFNVVRWTYAFDTLIDPVVVVDHIQGGQIHNGSRVLVGPDRKLYISTGEADSGELAQDMRSLNGKVLRFELDGSIPKDNPFEGSAIWSLGHRNPQGLCFGPQGLLFSTEHGHANDDELNLILKGRNYGWPHVTGGCDRPQDNHWCDSLDVVPALAAWTPTLAVSGIEYFEHPSIPEWNNSILLASLKDESLWVLKLGADYRTVTESYRYHLVNSRDSLPLRRLRDYCLSPDGRLFVSTSNIWSKEWNPDKIIEIKKTGVIPFDVRMVSPAAFASLSPTDVEFVWNRTAGDSRYELQVSDKEHFETLTASSITPDTAKTLVLPVTSTLYWRVREITSAGPWSETRTLFTTTKGVVDRRVLWEPSLSPNPARRSTRIANLDHSIVTTVSFVDETGKTVKKWQFAAKEQLLDLTEIAQGHYQVLVKNDLSSSVHSLKIIR